MSSLVSYLIICSITVILCAMFVIWQTPKMMLFSQVFKGLASFSFVTLGLFSIYFNGQYNIGFVFFALGLIASCFGDVFLAQVDSPSFGKQKVIFSGMLAFSVAQIMYYVAMIVFYGFAWWAVVVGIIVAVGVVFGEKLLKLNYGKVKPMVAVYSFLLIVNVAQSLFCVIKTAGAISTWLLFIGYVMFFISDLILSFIYFSAKPSQKLTFANLGAYYLAQILIAGALMFI
ncbi:MAG: lysoplasmalogenase family protein [Clostridia bacterium]